MDTIINDALARKVLSVVDAGLSNGLGKPVPGKMCVEAAVCYAMGLPHGDEPTCVAPALRNLKIRLNDSEWSSPTARAKGMRRLALAQLGSKDELNQVEFARRVALLAIRVSVPRALYAAARIHPDEAHKKALIAAAKKCETAAYSAARSAASAAYSAAYSAARSAAVSAVSAVSAAYSAARSAAVSAASAARSAAVSAVSAVSAARSAASAAVSAVSAAVSAVSAVSAARSAADSAVNAAYSAAVSAARDKELAGFAESVVQILVEMKAPGCQWLYLTEA